jgi:hypothetical protein
MACVTGYKEYVQWKHKYTNCYGDHYNRTTIELVGCRVGLIESGDIVFTV